MPDRFLGGLVQEFGIPSNPRAQLDVSCNLFTKTLQQVTTTNLMCSKLLVHVLLDTDDCTDHSDRAELVEFGAQGLLQAGSIVNPRDKAVPKPPH